MKDKTNSLWVKCYKLFLNDNHPTLLKFIFGPLLYAAGIGMVGLFGGALLFFFLNGWRTIFVKTGEVFYQNFLTSLNLIKTGPITEFSTFYETNKDGVILFIIGLLLVSCIIGGGVVLLKLVLKFKKHFLKPLNIENH